MPNDLWILVLTKLERNVREFVRAVTCSGSMQPFDLPDLYLSKLHIHFGHPAARVARYGNGASDRLGALSG